MNYETIRLAIDGRGVATVTLARGDKHNALDARMIAELRHAGEALADTAVRAVVLAADGASFCAGGDLGWMREQAAKDRAGKIAEAEALAGMLGVWNNLPKLVVARVQGPAYGGGVGLMAVADIAIGVEGTRFALSETRLGLIPATIGPFVVGRMGGGFARQVFLNARPFDCAFALRSGLLAAAVPAGELDAAVEAEIVAALACAPGAVADAKRLCHELAGPDPLGHMTMTADALADRWESAEAQAGIAAFFSRTTPSWRQDPKET